MFKPIIDITFFLLRVLVKVPSLYFSQRELLCWRYSNYKKNMETELCDQMKVVQNQNQSIYMYLHGFIK